MAKLLTATIAIVIIVAIGTVLLQKMDDAAAERHRVEIATQQQVEIAAGKARAARIQSASSALDAAMKDGTAGIAGTVVNHLRSDTNQIDAVIAALRRTSTGQPQPAVADTGLAKPQP